MPELPEVETIRRGLAGPIVGRTIRRVRIIDPRVVKAPAPAEFVRLVTGRRIAGLRRRGKYLCLDLEPAGHLLVHLKMSGRLLHRRLSVKPGARVPAGLGHLLLFLDDGSLLYYHDTRRFGGFRYQAGDPFPALALGPEPLDPDFSPARWRRILAGRKARIKSLLLDQQAVAGLGNIYAAEALFRAAIRPDRPAGSLSGAEAGRLYRSMRAVLKEALAAGGTSIQDYRQADGRSGLFQVSLRVYGRRGEACPCCGAPIEACREGSRTTYFCPGCQH